MTQKLLPYDRGIVKQENGYWCGPASAQVVLNSKGINVAESTLASEIATNQNGTDYIGLIERILDRRAPAANYTSVQMPNDPPTSDQKDRLWLDIVRSVNAGWGVIVNIVAPRSNYPRGVNGSTSPAYGGGTVYHYMSAMGYDDVARAVWIADSGFTPYGYWIAFDQLATLIPPKGYCYADVDSISAPLPEVAPGLNAESLAQAMGNSLPIERYAALLPAFSAAMNQAGCTTVERAAMWCAQVGHESAGLRYMAELWGPTSDQRTYDGRMGNGPGEGYKYRGRGPIQVTGKNNYAGLSAWAHDHGYVPTRTFFVDNPDALASDEFGFLGAVWYWTTQRPLNALADARDIDGATRAINGGTNNIEDRKTRYQRCLEIGAALLPTGDAPMSSREIQELKDYIDLRITNPIGSDVKDIREQLTGGRDAGQYPGYKQLGNRTLTDAVAVILDHLQIPAAIAPKEGKS